MLAKLRPRSAYDVMAGLALFVALTTGGAYAAATITSDDIVNETITGADVRGKANTLSTPAVNGMLTGNDISGQPAIGHIGQPFIDGSLTSADIKNETLKGDDVLEHTLSVVPEAVDADKLGGVAAKPVLQAVAPGDTQDDRCAERPTVTGTFCSEPSAIFPDVAFPWSNYGSGRVAAGYYKDAFGIVHLEGLVKEAGGQASAPRVFILPTGYRPAERRLFIVFGKSSAEAREGPGRVDVTSAGDVVVVTRPDSDPDAAGRVSYLSLDGISFRAA